MLACRICSNDIAVGAEVCPHCGIKKPDIDAYKSGNLLFGAASLILGLVMAGTQIWDREINFWLIIPTAFIFYGFWGLYLGVTGKDLDGNDK